MWKVQFPFVVVFCIQVYVFFNAGTVFRIFENFFLKETWCDKIRRLYNRVKLVEWDIGSRRKVLRSIARWDTRILHPRRALCFREASTCWRQTDPGVATSALYARDGSSVGRLSSLLNFRRPYSDYYQSIYTFQQPNFHYLTLISFQFVILFYLKYIDFILMLFKVIYYLNFFHFLISDKRPRFWGIFNLWILIKSRSCP